MADHGEESGVESAGEEIVEQQQDKRSSSSSSEVEKKSEGTSSSTKTKVWRFFGREEPVHKVFGGGKYADLFLWRKKKISGGVLGAATAIWILFDLLNYRLLPLVCQVLILLLVPFFIRSYASTFTNKSPWQIPEIQIPEDLAVNSALALRFEINRSIYLLKAIASGRDLRKFLVVIAGLWALSIIGARCNFLTLFYTVFLLLHFIPVTYEKYEGIIDAFGERAMIQIKKQYSVIDQKILGKTPIGKLKSKNY